MKRRLSLFLVSITTFVYALSFAPPVAAGGSRAVPNEVVVWLYRATDLPAVASKYGIDPAPISQFGTNTIYRLRIISGQKPEDVAKLLTGDSRVFYSEPNYINSVPEDGGRLAWTSGSSVQGYQTQWAPTTLRLAQAHTVTRGAGVKVAVLDTGVDATHELLAGRVAPGLDLVDRDTNPSEGDPAGLAYGHGTHVAGLVAMVAPEATIIPYRILDKDGVGNMWVLVEAIYRAANPDGNTATDDGANVINLSLSVGIKSKLLEDAVRYATCEDPKNCASSTGRGAVVVAAAGNEGADIKEYPAALDSKGVAAVAASTENNRLATFSSFGKWVDLAAPGEGIVSSVPGGYAAWSGTSMASPLVAGEAALVRAVNPTLKASDIVSRMVQRTVPLTGYKDLKRIDVAAALGR